MASHGRALLFPDLFSRRTVFSIIGEKTGKMTTENENTDMVLLIDCDPGVDDCVALMMALAHSPRVKIVGVTCVAGNTGVQQVTLNAARILKVCGAVEQVPIFRGCDEPILVMPNALDAGFYHGRDGLGDVPRTAPPCDDELLQHIEEEHAVNAILRLSREYEGQLQVLCLAPLTNVALAYKLDTKLPTRLKSLHIMGGTMRGRGNITPCAEYNFYKDPEAAHTVVRSFSSECVVKLVPYEAAVDHSIPVEWLDSLISGPSSRNHFFREIFKICQEYELKSIAVGISHGYVICDSYLAAVVLDPTAIKKSRHVRMGVELAGNITRGSLIIGYDYEDKELSHLSDKPIELIEEIDNEKYRELLMKAFNT